MGLISLGAGVAIGYVIGTKDGKEKAEAGFESLKRSAQETWEREDVQDFVSKATDTATKVSHDVAEGAKKAAHMATEAVKKASEKVGEAEDAAAREYRAPETIITGTGDVQSDPAQSTERKGTDWANEGGFKP